MSVRRVSVMEACSERVTVRPGEEGSTEAAWRFTGWEQDIQGTLKTCLPGLRFPTCRSEDKLLPAREGTQSERA